MLVLVLGLVLVLVLVLVLGLVQILALVLVRSGAARREQARRAEARAVQRLLSAFAAVSRHRGGEVTKLGAALVSILHVQPDTTAAGTSFGRDAGSQWDLNAPAFVPGSGSTMDADVATAAAAHTAETAAPAVLWTQRETEGSYEQLQLTPRQDNDTVESDAADAELLRSRFLGHPDFVSHCAATASANLR